MMRRALFLVPLFVLGGLSAACVAPPAAAPTPQPAPPPLPLIVGSPVVGSTLSTSTGAWLNSPTSFDYSWQRCTDVVASSCVQVATTPQYTLSAGDEGFWIFVGVTGVSAAGTGGSMSSAGVGPVTPV